MNVKYKLPFLLITLLCSQVLNAQFNTLTHTIIEKESITSLGVTIQNQKSDQSEKKRRGIKLFSSPSKAELKREIDTLKSMLMKNNPAKTKAQKFDFKRIEDSLILILKTNALLIKKSKSLKKQPFFYKSNANITAY